MRIRAMLLGGVREVREHPQLLLTIIVAVAIVASFVYVASSFISIARSAQEELTNVRVGSLQDAFSPLAAELWQEPSILRAYMQRLQALNQTIVEFDIVTQPTGGQWTIMLSSDPSAENTPLFRQDFLMNLARSDAQNSYTIQESENGVRYFYTARAIVSREGAFEGVALTKQTLSAADQEIDKNVQNATIILVVILLFLLLLFFRHARIIDYTVLYRKLREVDTLKDEFISMASHELRAPLTAIRGYAAMLKESGYDDAQRTQFVDRIDTSAQQLDALVADMLDVSRIEQGRLKVEPKPLDASAALAEICDIWEMRAKQKGLAVVREFTQGLTIMVDPDRFRQIAINLLSNAVKYTEKGTITVRTYKENDRFVLRVSDTGIGMSDEVRGKLFAKFYRAPGESVRKESGTGLGLWITKELIERMDGRVSVESIEGVGSHFIVSFPLRTA